jgi:hypothetical protein
MPPIRRLILSLAAVAALAVAAGAANAGCRLARDHACARPGAACPVEGRRGFCETTHRRTPRGVENGCICSTPISHGGGPSHRK